MGITWRHLARLFLAVTVGLGTLIRADVAVAGNDRVEFPDEIPGPPFYVLGINDDEWAAIFFIRDVSCTPETVNFFGFPGPAVFSCPLAVEGHAILDGGGGGLPRMFHLRQSAPMEAWFVTRGEFSSAIADNVLTKGELAALPSLAIGAVEHYVSTHHIKDGEQSVAGSVRGTLEDGRTFAVHASVNQRSSSNFPEQLFCGCSATGPVSITFG